jgi:prepilin-type N-terminal cleavage/methylation domain-containing protein
VLCERGLFVSTPFQYGVSAAATAVATAIAPSIPVNATHPPLCYTVRSKKPYSNEERPDGLRHVPNLTATTRPMKHPLKGFTLIELLIVIALIAVLAGAVIVALNPARQFANARNSTRWSHISTIMNAIQQNIVENRGLWTCSTAITLPTTSTFMQNPVGANGVNICGCLIPNQIASIPFDPGVATSTYTDCTNYASGYFISQDAVTHRITISAPSRENGVPAITITQ